MSAKIQAVIDLLGEDLVIKHIMEGDYSLKVKLAMITSNENNAVIDSDSQTAINLQ
jgi:hypothetical protein